MRDWLLRFLVDMVECWAFALRFYVHGLLFWARVLIYAGIPAVVFWGAVWLLAG